MKDDEQRRSDDDESLYIPPITKMKGFMYFTGFSLFIIVVLLNDSTIEVDPLWDRGLLIILVLVVISEVGSRIVKARSPKFTGNIYGDSIASNNPQQKIPAQGSWPDMGVWCPGSVDGWGVKTFLPTNCYAIFPVDLAQKSGVNLICHAHLRKYTDHATLPPHVRRALKKMIKPAYRKDMPVIFGTYPDGVNALTKSDTAKLAHEMETLLGVPEEKFRAALEIFERYAMKVSPFRYDRTVMDTKEMPMDRIEELSAEVSKKEETINYWQDYATTLERMLNQRKFPQENFMDRIGKKPEMQDQDG